MVGDQGPGGDMARLTEEDSCPGQLGHLSPPVTLASSGTPRNPTPRAGIGQGRAFPTARRLPRRPSTVSVPRTPKWLQLHSKAFPAVPLSGHSSDHLPSSSGSRPVGSPGPLGSDPCRRCLPPCHGQQVWLPIEAPAQPLSSSAPQPHANAP